jgi:hypothetical protein
MHPAGFDGKMLLSSGPVWPGRRCRRSPPWPPSHVIAVDNGHDIKDVMVQPRDDPQPVSPMSVYNIGVPKTHLTGLLTLLEFSRIAPT